MSLLQLPTAVSAALPAALPFAEEPPVYGGNAQLIAACVLGILAVVLLITWGKVHPFLALMLGSAVLGVVATMPPGDTVKSFVAGFGATAGAVGILIALGAMIGKLLEDSGGANRIVATMVGRVGPGGLPWVMAAIAAILGLPLFFEVGVVLLVPVVVLVAQRTGLSLMKVGIPALAGLSVLHGLVPPHPGPLTAIGLLDGRPRAHPDLRHPHRHPHRHRGRAAARALRRPVGAQVGERPGPVRHRVTRRRGRGARPRGVAQWGAPRPP